MYDDRFERHESMSPRRFSFLNYFPILIKEGRGVALAAGQHIHLRAGLSLIPGEECFEHL